MAEYFAKTNLQPYSLNVDENAYLFVQNNDAHLVWIDFCNWFGEKQKQGRFANTPNPNPQTPFVFPVKNTVNPAVNPATESQKTETKKAELSNIDKNAVIERVFNVIDANLEALKSLVRVLQ